MPSQKRKTIDIHQLEVKEVMIKVKHFGDITQIKGDCVPLVDIVTGGSPC